MKEKAFIAVEAVPVGWAKKLVFWAAGFAPNAVPNAGVAPKRPALADVVGWPKRLVPG